MPPVLSSSSATSSSYQSSAQTLQSRHGLLSIPGMTGARVWRLLVYGLAVFGALQLLAMVAPSRPLGRGGATREPVSDFVRGRREAEIQRAATASASAPRQTLAAFLGDDYLASVSDCRALLRTELGKDYEVVEPRPSVPAELPLLLEAKVWQPPWSQSQVAGMYARDTHPIPEAARRNGYMGDRHFEYWLSGLELFVLQNVVLRRHGVDVAHPPAALQPWTVLDFGGSTGRLSRHWVAQSPTASVMTTDTNLASIGFLCRHGMGQGMHNDFLPPLELGSDSISFFTALSVWTHMTAPVALAWLREVRRVLRPGGYAWITVMGDHTWRRIRQNMEADLLYSHIVGGKEKLVREDGSLYTFTKEDLARHTDIPYPVTVFQGDWRWPYKPGVPGDFMVNTFVRYEFIREFWGEILEVVDILPQNSLTPDTEWKCATPLCPNRVTGQDVVLLRKGR